MLCSTYRTQVSSSVSLMYNVYRRYICFVRSARVTMTLDSSLLMSSSNATADENLNSQRERITQLEFFFFTLLFSNGGWLSKERGPIIIHTKHLNGCSPHVVGWWINLLNEVNDSLTAWRGRYSIAWQYIYIFLFKKIFFSLNFFSPKCIKISGKK